MQIDTAEKLISALRASELFTPEQLWVVVNDLTGSRDDMPTLLRVLVDKGRCSVYQLRKVVHGKAAELKVGPYVISEKLGEGGMGKVYRARHVRMGREVALKVVRSNLLSSKLVRKRYDREVQIASSLSHPNVVRVYDAGEHEGRFYLAMEFVDGIDLSKMVREHRPLAVSEACEYVRQAAIGLHYAHEQELVHRDIKPSNIVVAGERHVPQAAEPALVKVLDMGLVRSVGFDDGGGGDLTRAGTVVGTPDYMAPEQAKNSSSVDRRADLYSLGCTLYFLLAAQPPFPSGTAIEKLLKHQLDAAAPLQSLRPEVPDEVEAIIRRLMAKKPEDRFQTAAEAAEALVPVARYPEGSPPVSTRRRAAESTGPAAETVASVGRSTLPPLPPPSSTVQPAPVLAASGAVAPSDTTPRPRDLPAALHAVPETHSPFASLTDPPSCLLEPAMAFPRAEKAAPKGLSRSRELIWVGAALAALLIGTLGLWLAVGGRNRASESASPGGSEPTAPSEPTPKTPPKSTAPTPKTTPMPTPPKRTHWSDLVVADPGLIVLASPSAYLRDKESPFAGGAGRTGPGKLAAWANRLATSTGLSLVDSERLILSMPAGSLDRYLLVSEGPYLTSGFIQRLITLPGLRQLKQPPKAPPGVRWFQAPVSRFMAVVPAAGAPVYGLASDPPLLAGMAGRAAAGDSPLPTQRIDPGMAAAIDSAAAVPPLAFVAVGPGFRLPFEFISPDQSEATLYDRGIDLVTIRFDKRDWLEIELVIVARDVAAIQDFLKLVLQRIADEFPINGGYLLSLIGQKKTSAELRDGKYRATFRWTLSPDEWSGILDRLVPQ